jgi:hypothetical protein
LPQENPHFHRQDYGKALESTFLRMDELLSDAATHRELGLIKENGEPVRGVSIFFCFV